MLFEDTGIPMVLMSTEHPANVTWRRDDTAHRSFPRRDPCWAGMSCEIAPAILYKQTWLFQQLIRVCEHASLPPRDTNVIFVSCFLRREFHFAFSAANRSLWANGLFFLVHRQQTPPMRHHEPTKHPIAARVKGHRVTGSAPLSLQSFHGKAGRDQANHTMPPSLKDKGGRLLAFANAGTKNELQSQVDIKSSSVEPPRNAAPPPAPTPRPSSFPREIAVLGGRNTAPPRQTTITSLYC